MRPAQFDSGGILEVPAPIGSDTSIGLGAQLSDDGGYESAVPDDGYYSYYTSIATLSFSGSTGFLDGVAAGSSPISAVSTQIIDSEGDEGEVGTNGNSEADVYAQTPTSVRWVNQCSAMNLTSSTDPPCTAGYAGYQRIVTLQVVDQEGLPINQSGISMSDSISIGSPNGLGIGNTRTGTEGTNSDGQWYDTYSVCSSVCPTGGAQTNATQSWTANSTAIPGTNSIVYKCSSITIDGQ
jgi:hypothetical protein